MFSMKNKGSYLSLLLIGGCVCFTAYRLYSSCLKKRRGSLPPPPGDYVLVNSYRPKAPWPFCGGRHNMAELSRSSWFEPATDSTEVLDVPLEICK